MSQLPVSLLLGALIAGGIILVFLLKLVLSAQPPRVEVVPSRMVGLNGKAVTVIAGEGRVMVRGEYWTARAREQINAGESVRVIGIDGMTLEVEACREMFNIPRPVSAVAPADSDFQ